MNRSTRIRRAAAVASAVLALGVFTVACEGTDGTGTTDTTRSKEKDSGGAADADAKPSKSVVDEFRDFVKAKGTDEEKAAVQHVTKIQGADRNNDILDTADIYTDFKTDLMDGEATGAAKLIASTFAEFQADRGKGSANGLVTVYNATGDMLGNGNY